jgi:hypothetical protein
MAITTAPFEFLQASVRTARPFRINQERLPARIASMAFSRLAIADSCFERSTGIK